MPVEKLLGASNWICICLVPFPYTPITMAEGPAHFVGHGPDHLSTTGPFPEHRREWKMTALDKITASLAVENALNAEKEYNTISEILETKDVLYRAIIFILDLPLLSPCLFLHLPSYSKAT